MESFVKWGKEKRQLDEIVGTALAAAALGGAAYGAIKGGLGERGKRKDQRGMFWLYRPDKPREDGVNPVQMDGIKIVQLYRINQVHPEDMIWVQGEQNWNQIKDAKKYLPFSRVSKGVANDKTVWWAYLDGHAYKFVGSKEFADAVAKRWIKPDTMVKRYGYDDWLPYKHKDVQDDMHQYVAATTPTLGAEEFAGKNAAYINAFGRKVDVKFEDLAKLAAKGVIRDDTSVWIAGFDGKKWHDFKELEHLLPSLGQAHVPNPRGRLAKFGKFLTKHRFRSRAERDDGYLSAANQKHHD
jgi:hypothetical protein